MNILIIGVGEIGTAIKDLLKDSPNQVNMWHRNTDPVINQKSLEVLVPKAEIIFLCIPSHAIRPAVSNFLQYLKPKTSIISLSKGVEKDTNFFIFEILEEILPKNQPYGLLSGPMLAEELSSGQGGAATLASGDKKVFDILDKLFKNTRLRLDYSSDVRGIALSGVLKNIYAIALGIAAGLDWEDNNTGWLVAESINEMLSIVEKLGGKKESVLDYAGVADLIATGFSDFSSNHAVGIKLAKHEKCEKNSEGCRSLSSILDMLGEDTKSYRVLQAVSQVVNKDKNAKTIFENLLQ